VLRVGRGTHRHWRVTVTAVCGSCVKAIIGEAPPALFLGRLATLLAALALAALLGLRPLRAGGRGLRRRLRPRASAAVQRPPGGGPA
jgi:hypothetical protein